MKQTIEFRKTVKVAELLGKLEASRGEHPWGFVEAFDACPVDVVREACIRGLTEYSDRSGNFISRELAEWAESRVHDLRSHHDDLWLQLLNWYVHGVKTIYSSDGKHRWGYDDIPIRAIEFAIEFFHESDFRRGQIAKVVLEKVRHDPYLYWLSPSMPRFLEKLLGLGVDLVEKRLDYDEEHWSMAERAIRRIDQVEDTTFLEQLKDLARCFEQGTIRTFKLPGLPEPSDPFAHPRNTTLLRTVVERLEKARKEQTPDLNASVGASIREKAGFIGSAGVIVKYPKRVKYGPSVTISVQVTSTKPREDNSKWIAAFDRFSIGWLGEGFLAASSLTTNESQAEKGKTELTARFGDPVDSCTFRAIPTKGNNRFWLTFRYEGGVGSEGLREPGTELAKTAGYILLCE